MQRRVESELAEADAALFVVNGDQGVGGAGDRFIAEALAGAGVPVVIAVNKVDRLDHARTVRGAAGGGRARACRTPRSSRSPPARASGVPAAASTTSSALLPEGPFYFPPEEFSDQPET